MDSGSCEQLIVFNNTVRLYMDSISIIESLCAYSTLNIDRHDWRYIWFMQDIFTTAVDTTNSNNLTVDIYIYIYVVSQIANLD